MDVQREQAYAAGAKVARSRMEREAPADAEALRRVTAADIVVVDGIYDHIHTVLDALTMPHTRLRPQDLDAVKLNPKQLLVVNCPGNISARAIGMVRDFVGAGGSLFTTDWALRHVVEPCFPGHVQYNDRPTADDVVGVEVVDAANPFLAGVMDGGDDPQWWLEGSSYPMTVLSDSVRVLLRSREMSDKYGEAALAVHFDYASGEVFHMVSHYYLQRTELRNARHAAPAASYFAYGRSNPRRRRARRPPTTTHLPRPSGRVHTRVKRRPSLPLPLGRRTA